jgi:hypothetical protein
LSRKLSLTKRTDHYPQAEPVTMDVDSGPADETGAEPMDAAPQSDDEEQEADLGGAVARTEPGSEEAPIAQKEAAAEADAKGEKKARRRILIDDEDEDEEDEEAEGSEAGGADEENPPEVVEEPETDQPRIKR